MLTALAPADGDAILPLADARVHLNLTADESFHDAAVVSLRADAINLVEEHSRVSLEARPFKWDVDAFAPSMRLPIRPSQSVDAIAYRDGNGTSVTLVATDWLLAGGFLNPVYGTRWPPIGAGRGAVQITFMAGYLTSSAIPPLLMAAVKIAMTAMFEDRGNPDLGVALKLANKFRRRTL